MAEKISIESVSLDVLADRQTIDNIGKLSFEGERALFLEEEVYLAASYGYNGTVLLSDGRQVSFAKAVDIIQCQSFDPHNVEDALASICDAAVAPELKMEGNKMIVEFPGKVRWTLTVTLVAVEVLD